MTISPIRDASGKVIGASKIARDITARKQETLILELLNETGAAIASELKLENLVQTVTDAGRKLSGAKFGAFFYNVIDAQGESYVLYTLSGAPREAFEKFDPAIIVEQCIVSRYSRLPCRHCWLPGAFAYGPR